MSIMDRVRAFMAPPQTKVSAIAPLFTRTARGMNPAWTPKNYEKFAEEGYAKNAIVFRCISLVAGAGASIPWKLYSGSGDKAKVIDDAKHPLLRLLRRPNPWIGGDMFWKAHLSFFMLQGNAYLEAIAAEGGLPMELHTHRPDRMKVIPHPRIGTSPGWYRYEFAGAKQDWEMDPIDGSGPMLHWKTFNPRDDWYGQSFIEAAAYSVDQHNSAGSWNQALLQNSGRPSGGFAYKPENAVGATLTKEQRDQINEDINQKLQGPRNAGNFLITDGGLEFFEMGLSPKEMDWLKGKNSSATDICQVLGCPEQMAGVEGSKTFANFEEARCSLYQDTAIPLMDALTAELNHWLVPAFSKSLKKAVSGELGDPQDSELSLKLDLDEVPALAVVREKVWVRVATADWLSPNEKREATGYEKIEDPAADAIYVDAGKLPLGMGAGDDATSEEQPELDEDGKPKLGPDGKPLVKKPVALGPDGKPLPGADGADAAAPPVDGSGNAASPDAVQSAALNGTQITALQGIIDAVTGETMAPETAVLLILACFPTLDPDVVQQMVDTAAAFEPVEPELPPMMGPDGQPMPPPAGGPPGAPPKPGAPKPPKKPGKPSPFKSLVRDLVAEGHSTEAAREIVRLAYGAE